MVLVFYIAMTILFLILITLILSFLFCISKLEINIKNLKTSNLYKEKNNNIAIINVSLKIGNFRWFKLKIKKEKIKSIYQKLNEEGKNKINIEKLKSILKKDIIQIFKDKELKNLLKNIKIELDEFKADITISTEDYIFTSFLVAIISIIISNILPHITDKKVYMKENAINYKVNPVYEQRNLYNIQLTTNVSIKIFPIVQIIFKLIKTNDKVLEKNKKSEKKVISKENMKINMKKLNIRYV